MTSRRPSIGLVLRLGIGVAILAYLAWRLDWENGTVALRRTLPNWPWLAAGLLFTFLGLLSGAVRWQRILRAHAFQARFPSVFRVFFIGQFFNAFMLGACGGDMVRAYYAARRDPERWTEAASTVFVDRALGLFFLVAWCCCLIPFRLPLFLSSRGTQGAGILMLLFLGAGAAALVAVFSRNLFEHFGAFQRLENDTRLGPLIRRAYEAFYFYRGQRRVVVQSLLLSFFNMAFLTLACYAFGRALELRASLLDFFTLFPLITVLAAIPLTPGALGLREGLFVHLFGAVGVAAAPALLLSLLHYGGGVLWSLLGAVFYFSYSPESRRRARGPLDPARPA